MKPVSVLMFGWEYPPRHLGGLGVACQGLVRGLKRNGVDVTLVLPHAEQQLADGCPVIGTDSLPDNALHVQSAITPYVGTEEYAHWHQSTGQSNEIYAPNLIEETERFAEESLELTKDEHPTVVHCHDWMTYGAGIRAAKYHHVPLVAHIHATELDRTYFKPNPIIYRYEQRGFQAADTIIAVSQYTKDILVQHYGIPSNKIAVVHNGIAPTWYGTGSSLYSQKGKITNKTVLFVGRLVLQKGTKQFLEMAAKVHAVDPAVQFIMAGDGHLMGELMEYACQLQLERNVLFAGRLDGQEIRQLFAQADCFVMPSLSEPFGLVALEAASMGTPVILSRQSGVREVLQDSLSVDFWDTAKMADCVLTVLRDKALAGQLRSRGTSTVSSLTWLQQASIVRSIYDTILHT